MVYKEHKPFSDVEIGEVFEDASGNTWVKIREDEAALVIDPDGVGTTDKTIH